MARLPPRLGRRPKITHLGRRPKVTCIWAEGPRTHLGRRPKTTWAQGPGIATRARKNPRANGNRAIRPLPGHDVLHRQRTTLPLTRAAPRSCTLRLTVEVSVAAFELLASRLVPDPTAVKNLAFSVTWTIRECRSDGRSSPPAVKCGVCIGAMGVSQAPSGRKIEVF